MIPVTELKNVLFSKKWRQLPSGQVHLMCPYCSNWFLLGSDFTINDDGLVSDVVYHICARDDDEYEGSPEFDTGEPGWVIRPKLIGWKE